MWEEDPKEERKKLYYTIFWFNIIIDLLYYFWYFFLNGWPFNLIEWLFHFPTTIPIINTFLFVQLWITLFMIKQLKTGAKKKNKENILWVVASINLIIFIILSTVAIKSYFWETVAWIWDEGLGFWGTVMLIISMIGLGLWIKDFFFNVKDIIEELLWLKEPEETADEEDEVPIEKYDWVQKFYDTDENPDIEEDTDYFRIPQPVKVLPFLIQAINSTLLLEKSKLVQKDVLLSGNAWDNIVQVDYPIINDEDDIYELIDKEDFKYSNKYITINNSYVAFKLKTKYLSNPKHLVNIGEEILPAQVTDSLWQVPFLPLKKLQPWSIEYREMTQNGKKRPYPLFQSITTSKIWTDWYVILNYTKWYKQLVTFRQLDPLPAILSENTDGHYSQKFNPRISFWFQSTWWYISLFAKTMRHLLFGWQSGSWKSVFLNSLIYQLLYLSHPDEVQLILVDPLKVSFRPFKKIKNLLLPVAMSEEDAIKAILRLEEENNKRYSFLEAAWYEDIYEYNDDIENKLLKSIDEYGLATKKKLPWNTSTKYEELETLTKEEITKLQSKRKEGFTLGKKMSQVILIYDEFNKYNGSPLYEKNKILDKLTKLSEQGRKAWIILILGTQKIDADSVPSGLRENFPTRICLKVMSRFNSRAIIGQQAENNGMWVTLTGSWDMLVYNWESLDINTAVRGQGFYVSEEDMDDLLRKWFETFWTNDFVYQEGTEDNYLWLDEFYTPEEIEEWVLTSEELEKNKKREWIKWIKFKDTFKQVIKEVNLFFKFHRTELLDKESLANESKNIEIGTLEYSTKEELREALNNMNFSNKYINITKSYIDFKLNTESLSTWDKLYKMEEKLELKLIKLKESIKFYPKELLDESSGVYQEMIKEGKPYQLIDNFEIAKEKNIFYLRINFNRFYKQLVIFPSSKTILQVLIEEFGDKNKALNKWIPYIVNHWEIEEII